MLYPLSYERLDARGTLLRCIRLKVTGLVTKTQNATHVIRHFDAARAALSAYNLLDFTGVAVYYQVRIHVGACHVFGQIIGALPGNQDG